jgi:hypothetical protein
MRFAMKKQLDERELIGEIGEQIVQEFLNSTRSSYKYDSEKDGTFLDMIYQVKTFRLNNITQGFWLGDNKEKSMWKNVDNVDMLFFIRIPEKADGLATLYLCPNHTKAWVKAFRNDGVGVRCYPLTKCVPLGIVSPERSKILYENSVKISTHKRYDDVK